jgi:glycosyltransferase involved in cell wall biosynthesis
MTDQTFPAGHQAASRLPTTSVIMATFNGATFLAEQLASIARQTRLPDELIISDDRSRDSTVKIARAFAETAPFPVRIFVHRKNLGYAKNFISAAQQSTGELLLFSDQDDLWCDDKIAVLSEVAASCPESVLSHDISIFSTDPRKASYPSYYRYLESQGFPPAVCLKGCTLAIKAAFIAQWGWPSDRSTVSHDFWVALLATAFNQRRYVDKVLVQHRLHTSNTSGWIASQDDLVRPLSKAMAPQAALTDLDLLIELCIKPWNLGWTDIFARLAEQKGPRLNPDLVTNFILALRKNAAWYAGHKRA